MTDFFLYKNYDTITENMQKYNPSKIERKWQKKWYDSNVFKAQNNSRKEKFYLLDEFPYPSGDGLHVGHCRPYIGLDIIARKRRMQGQNVLFPMGWDAFGLPAENYAIKTGIHPALSTKKSIGTFKKQMKNLGLSFDWSREINTTDPTYYKWTQWIFLKLFEKELAYKDKMAINWCPKDKIGLANEEVVNGKCERCGTQVEKREKEQWLIKITKYADRLIKDLDLVDYPERVKIQQKEWIGKSEGMLFTAPVKDTNMTIQTFSAHFEAFAADTFVVIAPDHPILTKLLKGVSEKKEVLDFADKVIKKRIAKEHSEEKEVEGIFTGRYIIDPVGNGELPIWVANFALADYGTGIVKCSCHDERDFKFAKKYSLKLKPVLFPEDKELAQKVKDLQVCYTDMKNGILIEPKEFHGKKAGLVKSDIIAYLEKNNLAKREITYKLRDWIFSRQHYWGEPIPMIHCKDCGWVPVPEKDLPVELPKVKKYQPTDTGESPLASMEKWLKVTCPKCGGDAQRETDTMPNWAGSNWYYLRYTDPRNNKKLADEKALKYWMPVDWYNGGMEHTTLHLLYSRFVFKFLWDIGAVPKQIGSEPYKKRTSHGVILGEGGIKMSKSRGNVINPDDVVAQYGADTLRVYEMFMGPFEQMIPWDQKGIIGARRFLEKIYTICHQVMSKKPKTKLDVLINKTIKKVSEDIETMKFNTAISSLMILVNSFYEKPEVLTKQHIKNLLLLLSPFAPHLAEELWEKIGFKGLCSQQSWPKYNAKLTKEDKVFMIMQINGKVRDKIEFASGMSQKEIEEIVLHAPKIKPWLEGKQVKKIIFVPNKLINIVI